LFRRESLASRKWTLYRDTAFRHGFVVFFQWRPLHSTILCNEPQLDCEYVGCPLGQVPSTILKVLGRNSYCPRNLELNGLASWCVAVGPRELEGSEETPPTCRITVPTGYKSRGLATEQKRNVQLDMAMTHL